MDCIMENAPSALTMASRRFPMRENVLTCPECPAAHGYEIIEEFKDGDWVCTGCGMVVETIIDDGADWRSFANDDGSGGPDRSRVGGQAGEELSTIISFQNNASSLAKAQKRSKDAEKASISVQRGYSRINDFCEKHGLSTAIKDQANQMYKLTQDAHAFRGKAKQEALLGALVFLACRQLKQPRTFREEGNSKMAKGAPASTGGEQSSTKAGRVKEPVARFVSFMEFKRPFIVETTAMRLAEEAETINTPFDGRAPTSLAAAYTCIASWLVGEPRKCKEIAKRCSVGEATLRTILKSFVEMKDQLVDQTWKGVDASRLKDIMER
ncbi:transcription initiation factor IIB [Apiospora phragmitis]|uniref:General transcription factor TFIIB n=1 Tax=Apiospora phragmitis TaxID=2905665 RepID=A0ABR1UM88_9PEZI